MEILLSLAMATALALSGLGSLQELALSPPTTLDVTDRPATMFKAYLKKFGKQYEGEELARRFQIFKNSLKEISLMNRESGATFGLTKFSDTTRDELTSMSSGYNRTLSSCNQSPVTYRCGGGPFESKIDYHYDKTIPYTYDWRNVSGHNFVGPVLDQKQCNGCWAFGIVGAMETQAAFIRGQFGPRLSIQQLIDCSEDTKGCANGNVVLALNEFCQKQWGVVTEEEYPLKLVTQHCKYYDFLHRGLKIRQFWKICNITESDIPRLVYFHGPVIVVVNADPWLGYVRGVIQGACVREAGITRDHVVQIVGYDMSSAVPYYIVRNSWGEDFGEGGYVKLAIGRKVCGVNDERSPPSTQSQC